MEGPEPGASLGPRFSAYVVADVDRAIFTVGRHPAEDRKRQRAEDLAQRLSDLLGDRTLTYREAGKELGVNPNMLRYATTTGTVGIRWEGSGRPTIWIVPRPQIEPAEARLELARRFLHVMGPAPSSAFGKWAGIGSALSTATFQRLGSEITPVRTPIGDAWILSRDETELRSGEAAPASVRLLPSGDTYYLLWGADRELVVPDATHREALWTSRVWPGALLVRGEIVGTWRRSKERVTIEPWRSMSAAIRRAVDEEAASLPIPDLERPIAVTWGD